MQTYFWDFVDTWASLCNMIGHSDLRKVYFLKGFDKLNYFIIQNIYRVILFSEKKIINKILFSSKS